jgi:DNA-binding CsgD family transcriptional regulator
MFANKTAVLAQINSVIQNKASADEAKQSGFMAVHRTQGNSAVEHKMVYSCNNREQLKKLQQRIESLEEHSDHLLYFIHFLFQTFAEPLQDLLSREAAKEEMALPKPIEPIHAKTTNRQQAPPVNEKISLTKREYEVFNLLIKGLCAKEIANKLFISEATVITHKKHMKEKFKAKNTAEFISMATAFSSRMDVGQ